MIIKTLSIPKWTVVLLVLLVSIASAYLAFGPMVAQAQSPCGAGSCAGPGNGQPYECYSGGTCLQSGSQYIECEYDNNLGYYAFQTVSSCN